jgi:hypothetical protein
LMVTVLGRSGACALLPAFYRLKVGRGVSSSRDAGSVLMLVGP